MLNLLLLLVMVAPPQYAFVPGKGFDLDVSVRFDGYLPIFGGREAKVDVMFLVGVEGAEPKDDALRATSEIREFKIELDGAPLPLTVESIRDYFPRSTVTLTPFGRVVESDAGDRRLPIQLPGLDPGKLPQLTFLPLELPSVEAAPGMKWEFTRPFTGADMRFACEVVSVEGSLVRVKSTMRQSSSVLEGPTMQIVADEKDAASRVETELEGSGKGVFDRELGRWREFDVKAVARGKETNLRTRNVRERVLTTTVRTRLRAAN